MQGRNKSSNDMCVLRVYRLDVNTDKSSINSDAVDELQTDDQQHQHSRQSPDLKGKQQGAQCNLCHRLSGKQTVKRKLK